MDSLSNSQTLRVGLAFLILTQHEHDQVYLDEYVGQ